MEIANGSSTTNLNNILEFANSINTHHPVKQSLSKAMQNGDVDKAWSLVLYYSEWFAIKGWAVARLANDYVTAGRNYHQDGSVKSVIPYVGGIKHGIAKTWHINGKVESECAYADGKRQGQYRSYYDTGAKEIKCFYKDGLLDGTHTQWQKNGKVYQTTKFSKGRLI